uniref:Uncharacterized protein n=1 Tax=Arundo donax TaxID=35708 RepID=A0A0A8ZH01_ARUDO
MRCHIDKIDDMTELQGEREMRCFIQMKLGIDRLRDLKMPRHVH